MGTARSQADGFPRTAQRGTGLACARVRTNTVRDARRRGWRSQGPCIGNHVAQLRGGCGRCMQGAGPHGPAGQELDENCAGLSAVLR